MSETVVYEVTRDGKPFTYTRTTTVLPQASQSFELTPYYGAGSDNGVYRSSFHSMPDDVIGDFRIHYSDETAALAFDVGSVHFHEVFKGEGTLSEEYTTEDLTAQAVTKLPPFEGRLRHISLDNYFDMINRNIDLYLSGIAENGTGLLFKPK